MHLLVLGLHKAQFIFMELDNMTDQDKIAQGLCTAQTDSLTGEVTNIPYSDEEVARLQTEVTQ